MAAMIAGQSLLKNHPVIELGTIFFTACSTLVCLSHLGDTFVFQFANRELKINDYLCI